MFCLQCEQTAKGTGCTVVGVCGKKPEIAALQDLLLHALKDLSLAAREGRSSGLVDETVDRFTTEALFSTLTNVNFDGLRFAEYIERSAELAAGIKEKLKAADSKKESAGPVNSFVPASGLEALVKQGMEIGQPWDGSAAPDIQSLQQIMLFGLKGLAAYTHHAAILGQEDEEVYAFIHEALAALTDPEIDQEQWVKLVLKVGEVNLKAMELLDAGNTGRFGHPVPTEVPLGQKKGKCLLVSGHDLHDLQMILEQTAGKNIYIYTHGEMLPAHGYPELKKYEHLYGHYGTAWQNQKKEFARFPGAIVMTTNCLQEPQETYLGNIFTTAAVGWHGAVHLREGDFSPAIEKTLAMPGFDSDADQGSVLTGFARNAVLAVAGKVIDAVKAGAIKHFFLVGGCDGAKTGRSYYTEFVEQAPADTVILTLACGKFRFFDRKLGDIGGVPRLLDLGQCNDAYSAIQVASALADAFNCGVNELPLTLILSWYEQKACAILLSLFHLGIKNIHLGPSLPAFITPNNLDFLVKTFNIKPISTPAGDLAAVLNK